MRTLKLRTTKVFDVDGRAVEFDVSVFVP